MSRNMKDANKTVFQRLVRFADDREHPIPHPHAARWVHSNVDADEILIEAKIHRSMSFGRFRHLAWLEHQELHFIASVGFDHEIEDPNLMLLEDIQGFDVCLLSELRVAPNASGIQVYNVVSAGSRDDDPGYKGHENGLIMGLFPNLRIYQAADPVRDDIVASILLGFSVEESRHGGSWIETGLADELSALAQRNIASLPYDELCRSTLDLDPRSLFMSLYRCIEATYAHSKASKLKQELSVEQAWHEIAATLEKVMSWRPLEESSLQSVLSFANPLDLKEVCACLGVELKEDSNIAAAAGRSIYSLRNRIVHYRPAHDPIDLDSVDWNRLCQALATIAGDVVNSTYVDSGPTPAALL